MSVQIRPATPADADTIARMWRDFAAYLRTLGDTDEQNFGAEVFLRDGFGPDPAFAGLVAEQAGEAAGYLLYYFGYDVDRAARVMFIADLWVDPGARRAGVGRALMQAAAARARDRGAVELIWAVFAPNRLAAAFYESLGAAFFRDLQFMHLPASAL
jgi:ribosomal protein S18 acetylase RimI-like enzyme